MTDVDQTSDEQFVDRGRAGDREAFAVLVERYWNRVFGWLYKMSHSIHLAEDLTQDTFCKAWAGLPMYQHGPGFHVWLFRIARNAWIDHTRRGKLPSGEAQANSVESREPEPLVSSIAKEDTWLLRRAVAELPVEYREALLLRSEQSLSFAEIAKILEAKEDTVRWRVYKARQLLLKKLAAVSSREELPS